MQYFKEMDKIFNIRKRQGVSNLSFQQRLASLGIKLYALLEYFYYCFFLF